MPCLFGYLPGPPIFLFTHRMCKDPGAGLKRPGAASQVPPAVWVGGSPFWEPGQPLVGVYDSRLGTPHSSQLRLLARQRAVSPPGSGPLPHLLPRSSQGCLFEPLLSGELDCGNSTRMFYSETTGIGCGKQRGFPRESGPSCWPLAVYISSASCSWAGLASTSFIR